MIDVVAEQPLLSTAMLGVMCFGFFYGWLQTGKRPAGIAAIVCLGLIPVAWIVAQRWVTDRERIERLIYEVADAVEANDHARAVAVIGDPAIRFRAQAELNNYEFRQADVNSIRRISVDDDAIPPEAEVELTVKVVVSQKSGQIKNVRVPRRLLLRFERSPGGEWSVVDYRHGPIAGGTDAFSTFDQP